MGLPGSSAQRQRRVGRFQARGARRRLTFYCGPAAPAGAWAAGPRTKETAAAPRVAPFGCVPTRDLVREDPVQNSTSLLKVEQLIDRAVRIEVFNAIHYITCRPRANYWT